MLLEMAFFPLIPAFAAVMARMTWGRYASYSHAQGKG